MKNDIEITTMCAVIKNNKVLMINRSKSWKGWAFPGGHLENGESIVGCVKREMFEETGIMLKNIFLKGMTNIYNTESHKRHIIYNFVCDDYSGIVKTRCDEGEIEWIELHEIEKLLMAEGMQYRLPLFIQDKKQELYIEWNEEQGYTYVKYYEM